jgi:hypothetical protein
MLSASAIAEMERDFDEVEQELRAQAGLVRLQVVTGRLYRPVHDVLAAAGPSALLPARIR